MLWEVLQLPFIWICGAISDWIILTHTSWPLVHILHMVHRRCPLYLHQNICILKIHYIRYLQLYYIPLTTSATIPKLLIIFPLQVTNFVMFLALPAWKCLQILTMKKLGKPLPKLFLISWLYASHQSQRLSPAEIKALSFTLARRLPWKMRIDNSKSIL